METPKRDVISFSPFEIMDIDLSEEDQMSSAIRIDVSPGELIDKLTILEIKRERIREPEKLINVLTEYGALMRAYESRAMSSDPLIRLHAELKGVNEQLWDIEDEIRDCERRGDFGETFIGLARAVYRTNDRRCELKRQINLLLRSTLIEEKSYQVY
jgi:hypothetical protein